ncbi:MAG: NADH-quinone oxidoreductase subunit F [Candidatus Margulisiibacteriota bacterium]|nr:MAG: NADH dehydrogenase [Candidatus Margulisbacteria bacterium GWD2_39_127]OGI01815.1 MAG: NADH dehydrogenase [Candidatus Margulisbacteria bacterium GWF2_38_17]OGI10137.1 MAG: NADH dehydrogenase [Candidatus Margulisbacteria bacterium GWE2_39_32]PZM79526.1 MAG: NADH-quinone oxidoreductase subunit F [Candidatus Margulisiibacteriota bacterium]HAR63801.1 NADH-quinone oxidoreductase subunit F [Candidatus Margulisiibacteriota bacterium]
MINPKYAVSICAGAKCINKNKELIVALNEELDNADIADKVQVLECGCLGYCEDGPVMFIHPDNIMYTHVQKEDIREIVQEHLKNKRWVTRLILHRKQVANNFFPTFGDVAFFGKQYRITLRNCGVIDPESISDYLSFRGYEALAKVLTEYTPQGVIDEISASGLRGRGGGGFLTGKKWQLTRNIVDDEKYVICNADEGDPGAFMDRSAIEGDPHTILEGMIICGYAVGSHSGIVYIRAEYPLAIKRLEIAIAQAKEKNLLGNDILGSGFDFDIQLRLGAGAFVCGEETALINSIEGKRGMPVPRPPYPSERGLFGKSTVINNVETWANVPDIVLDGAVKFASLGTEKSKGTKVFALAGAVENTGLVEVQMGTTLREIIFDIGGGILGGRKFKAVQTGGPSGGCLPSQYLDTPIDYDSLAKAGSIMGSGGMIVMDDSTCMVDVAKYFLDFTQNESCGKCTPCREGTKRMLEILTRITQGKGVDGDIEKLERLGLMIKRASLCGLGKAAPNPVLSTIKNFREEYESHIKDKKCLAGVCRELMHYSVDTQKCIGCGACKRNCPVNCINGEMKHPHVIDETKCIHCGQCYDTCKFAAITRG